MKQLLPLFLIAASASAFAQKTIEGEIRSKADSMTLPGVTVIEVGTDNQVSSDPDGKFKIVCKSANSVLQFSFVGSKTIEVEGNGNYLVVYLEEDLEQLKVKTRFGIYPRYTSIGFNSGFNYTPVGLNVTNALPTLFGIRMLTATSVTYRTDFNKNHFFDVEIQKERLIDFRYNARWINLILGYNRRNIYENSQTWDTEELTIVPELRLDEFLFLIGYGRQSLNDIETLKSNEGFIFGLGRYFKWNGLIIGTAKKWNNYWQAECKLMKGFEKNDFEFGVRFEMLDKYTELDLLLLYRIHY